MEFDGQRSARSPLLRDLEKSLQFDALDDREQQELLTLFANAPGDFKNLILGNYGKLPMGWSPDWVYQSAFGDDWSEKIKQRQELLPLESLEDDDLDRIRPELATHIGRAPTEEEFILYLMHPKDALDFIAFRQKYARSLWFCPPMSGVKGCASWATR